jgi:diguanylate cyclase (GGDEF)-like protein/PAS domain S-box-containing protein
MRIFWKDKNSRYIGCNSNFARDAGFNNVNEIIGKYDDDLAWQVRADYYRAIDLEVMQLGVPKASYEELEKTADGHEMILKSSKIPLRQDSGEVIGVLGIYEDITQIKKSEAEQIINRERLNFALKGANDGLWDWNLDTNEVYYSPRWKSMLGYRDDELGNTLDTWSSLVDPKDSAATLAHAQSYINGDCASFETEFRMRHKDGRWVDILSRAKLALDVNGVALKPQRLIGTHVDISHLKNVESELRKKEGYQRALLDNFPFMVWLKDLESRFLSVNKVHANNFGEDNPEKLIGKTDFDYSPIEIAENYRKDDLSVLQTKQPKSVEETYVDTKGNQHWIETFKAPVTDQDGNLLGTVGFSRDISDRKKIETELQIAATAFESQEGMIVTDANANILKINHSFTRITGYSADEAVGKKMKLLKSGVHDAAFYKEMWDSIQSQGSWQGEIWNKRKCGEIYPEWLTITAVKNRENVVTHYVGTMIDITARKSIEERVHHLAHYDPLTDLPNRTLLTDRLHQALAQVRREKTKLALMFLDLDKFKPVNDLLGHDIGDLLLKAVAERLTTRIKRQTDTVSRIGGDEFVIVLSQIESNQDAALVANEVVSALTQPFLIEQHTILISCSIGIGIYPLHGSDVVSLMRVADQAMYEAKRAGRGCFRFYTEDTTNQSSLDNLK